MSVGQQPAVLAFINLGPTGTVPTSGAPQAVDSSGPFLIERQSLTIDYTRVPYGKFNFDASNVTLSGVSGTSYHVYGTQLVAEVKATYSRKKSYDFFSTTAFQQPQKFEVLALSADDKGTTYGNTNASALGPMGSIVTKREFYKRTPWIDAVHSEVNRSMEGRSYYAVQDAAHTGVTATVNSDGLAQDNPPWFITPYHAGTFLSRWDVHPYKSGHYTIYGRYNTSKESLRKIRAFISDIGVDISRLAMFDNPANMATRGGKAGSLAGDQGFVEYDSGRHDYD